jgi:UDPglucose--hexose-1-phosphate uridylyltransferase
MTEIRTNIMTGDKVIIAEEREKRPKSLNHIHHLKTTDEKCPFCRGNEDKTPPEIYRVGGDNWTIRVIPNKFPVLEENNEDSYGSHEIVIDSPIHDYDLGDMDYNEIEKVFQVLIERYKFLKKDKKIKYIQIFKNHKKESGASLKHPHFQIVALPILPQILKKEMLISERYYRKNKICIYCHVIEDEKKQDIRVINETSNYMIVAPFASKYNYESWIIPRDHCSDFGNICYTGELASSISYITRNMKEKLGDPPFNLFIHTDTEESVYYHWHIEINPRISIQSGLELSTGIFVNTVSPEQAAKRLK